MIMNILPLCAGYGRNYMQGLGATASGSLRQSMQSEYAAQGELVVCVL